MIDETLTSQANEFYQETRRVSGWMEFGCMLMFYLALLIGCTATLSVAYSAEYIYHQWTAFHVVAVTVILLHTSIAGMMFLMFPRRQC